MYEDCVRHCLGSPSPLPQWYLLRDGETLAGCAGLIPNDFISRMDLWPWICALYVAREHRGHEYGRRLLDYAKLTPDGSVSAKSISARNTSAITNATAFPIWGKAGTLGAKARASTRLRSEPGRNASACPFRKKRPFRQGGRAFCIHKVRTAARNRSVRIGTGGTETEIIRHRIFLSGRGLCGEERRQQRAERGHRKEQEALPPAHVAAAKAADQMGGEQGDERGQHRLAEAVRGPRGRGWPLML